MCFAVLVNPLIVHISVILYIYRNEVELMSVMIFLSSFPRNFVFQENLKHQQCCEPRETQSASGFFKRCIIMQPGFCSATWKRSASSASTFGFSLLIHERRKPVLAASDGWWLCRDEMLQSIVITVKYGGFGGGRNCFYLCTRTP